MEFNGKSTVRQLGDIIPVAPIEPASIEDDGIRKVRALLKEALEILEKEY